jgi:hypothetical protein
MNIPEKTHIKNISEIPPPYSEQFSINQDQISIAQQNITKATDTLIEIFNQCGMNDNIDELIIKIQNSPEIYINDKRPIIQNLAEKINEYNSIKLQFDNKRIIISTENLKIYFDKQLLSMKYICDKQLLSMKETYDTLFSTELFNSKDQTAIILTDKYIDIINNINVMTIIRVNMRKQIASCCPNAYIDGISYKQFIINISLYLKTLTHGDLKQCYNNIPNYFNDKYKTQESANELIQKVYAILSNITKHQFRVALSQSKKLAMIEDEKYIILFKENINSLIMNYNNRYTLFFINEFKNQRQIEPHFINSKELLTNSIIKWNLMTHDEKQSFKDCSDD